MSSRTYSVAEARQRIVSNPAGRFKRTMAHVRDNALLGFVLVSATAMLVRATGLSRGFELWVDEMVYTDLSNSVSHGQLPNLSGAYFFLHPPGAFLIDGLVIRTFGISGTLMSMVYDLRWVNAVLGSLTVGLAFLVVRRVAGRDIAWLCATLLAFDPFVLRNNSRVFLETPAVVFIVGGYLLIVNGLCANHARLSRLTLVFSGLLFGYGILTKDVFAVMTIVPVILAGFWAATLPWRDVAVICCAAAAPYISYITLVSTDGHYAQWLLAKETGLERMVGLKQTTGFNAPDAPSFLSRLIAEFSQFGTSYVLLVLCPIVAVIAMRSRHAGRRLIGLCALAMGVFGIYTAVFGTFEEQYGYGVMVASVLGIGVAYAELRERRPARATLLRLSCAVLVVLTVGLGIRAEATADDGFLQVRAWVQAHLPPRAHVAVTNSTGQWAFMNDHRFGVWPSASSMWEHKADYILTQSLPTSEGYGYARPEMLEWLESNAKAVFTTSGPTNGATVLWYVKPSLLRQAAKAGIGS
jgi:4-amino-4-deoxy-L-arabinose transferase-like glycosyltransferase